VPNSVRHTTVLLAFRVIVCVLSVGCCWLVVVVVVRFDDVNNWLGLFTFCMLLSFVMSGC
jgi:hypothetical protein